MHLIPFPPSDSFLVKSHVNNWFHLCVLLNPYSICLCTTLFHHPSYSNTQAIEISLASSLQLAQSILSVPSLKLLPNSRQYILFHLSFLESNITYPSNHLTCSSQPRALNVCLTFSRAHKLAGSSSFIPRSLQRLCFQNSPKHELQGKAWLAR